MRKWIGKTLRRSPALWRASNRIRSGVEDVAESAQFYRDFVQFGTMAAEYPKRFAFRWSDRMICLGDRRPKTPFDRHYIYHTSWAARVLSELKPDHHIDIGSSISFCSLVSSFIPMTFLDVRPPELLLSGLDVGHGNLTELPFATDSIPSLSCMHVVEHVGLGRYGDPLDPLGDLKAMAELKRVLAIGGYLIFVVPVGEPRIQFHAHRIYSFAHIIEGFAGLELVRWALIPDDVNVGLLEGAPPSDFDRQRYGCGCFLFRKPGSISYAMGEQN